MTQALSKIDLVMLIWTIFRNGYSNNGKDRLEKISYYFLGDVIISAAFAPTERSKWFVLTFVLFSN